MKTIKKTTNQTRGGTTLKTIATSLKAIDVSITQIKTDVAGLKEETAGIKKYIKKLVTRDELEQRLEEYLPKKDWILKLEDRMVTTIRKHEKENVLHGGTMDRHDREIRNHDKRILVLENK